MGFLHKIWDETVAGPAPDSGLGRLWKFNSFSESRRTTFDGNIPVSRSITVLRRSTPGTPPNVEIFSPVSGESSPANTGTPNSPRSPADAAGYFKKVARRKQLAGDMKTPAAADNDSYWILLSALDRA